MRTSTKLYIGVVAAILAITAGIVFNASGPAEYDAGTPEATVQKYVQAVLDEDFDSADSLLTAAAVKQCKDSYFQSQDVQRVRISDSRTSSDEATIEVDITQQNRDDPFAGEYSVTDRFLLERDGADWKISSVPWILCEGR